MRKVSLWIGLKVMEYNNYKISNAISEDEHVSMSNLYIRPDMRTPGKVNLTWNVPEHSKRHITGISLLFVRPVSDSKWLLYLIIKK